MHRIWLALYNSYKGPFGEPHRRAIVRTANLCYAFDFGLALFGFNIKNIKTFLKREQVNTSIGKGDTLTKLVKRNRIESFDFPGKGWPAQLGIVVAATCHPTYPADLKYLKELGSRKPLTLVFGLGPHGMPQKVVERCEYQFDVTGKETSLETATAIGAVAGQLALLDIL